MWKLCFMISIFSLMGSKLGLASDRSPGPLRELQFTRGCPTLTNVKVECNSATSTDQKVSFNVAGGSGQYTVIIKCDSKQATEPLKYDGAGDKSTVIPYCAGAITISAAKQRNTRQGHFCHDSEVVIDSTATPDCCYNDLKCKLDPKVVEVAGCNVMVLATMYPPATAVSDVFSVNAAACSSAKLALTLDRTQNPMWPTLSQYCPKQGGVSLKRTYHVTPYDRAGNALTAMDCVQNFLVKHTTPPVFSGSCASTNISNITIGCRTTGSVDFTLPTDCHAKGVCSNYDVPVVFGGSLAGSVLHRTWTATDLCGNKNYKTQDITLTNTGC